MTPQEHFLKLDSFLFATRQYWQLLAFDHLQLPWHKPLNAYLNSLSDAQISILDGEQNKLYKAFSPYIPNLEELEQLTQLPSKEAHTDSLPFWLTNGIKGRKLDQLNEFVSQVLEPQLPVLEWCAGKGHLGRILAFKGVPRVDSIELQAPLCKQGAHAAKSQKLNVHFYCADVLKDTVIPYFKPEQHAIALHACGALHTTFLKAAVKANNQKISLSPCCYHLFTDENYTAMSEIARQSQIELTHSDMKLALQETVTAPNRIAQIRKKEVTWRLGFDALRRDLTGKQEYVSVPSVNKSIFSGQFVDFCKWAAKQKQLALPKHFDAEHYLAQGEARKIITDRIELVRHIFRRAIELWLVLDRVLYLQVAGYDVKFSEFCDKKLTPRNILIQARL